MNTIDHNLGINIASVSSSTGLQLIPSDAKASVFWLTHPKCVSILVELAWSCFLALL